MSCNNTNVRITLPKYPIWWNRLFRVISGFPPFTVIGLYRQKLIYGNSHVASATHWSVGQDGDHVGHLFYKYFTYFFMRHRERGRNRGRLLHSGSLIWDSIPGPRLTPWAEGRCPTTEPPGVPTWVTFYRGSLGITGNIQPTNHLCYLSSLPSLSPKGM